MPISLALVEEIQSAINRIKGENYVLFFAQSPKGVGLEPTFNHKELKEITPIQPNVFGIYVIRNICRGLFLSLNHLAGGKLLLENRLYAPCLASIYSGTFHLLNSLLSKNGKVVEPLRYVEDGGIIENKSSAVYSTFSINDRKWYHNRMSLDHKKKWRLINDLYRTKNYPRYFDPLFKYWFGHLSKNELSMEEYMMKILRKEKIERYEFNEKINEFLDHFVGFRHMASYKSFGGDIYFHDYVMNAKPGDWIPDKMGNHCEMYLEFSHALLSDILISIKFLLNQLTVDKKQREFLWWSINQPAFDYPEINLFEKSIQNDLKAIIDWFISPRQKKLS